MSLILDALKKAEREKGVDRSSVVVVGRVSWGAAAPPRWRVPLVIGASLALAVAALGGWWLLRLRPAAGPAAATAVPQPSATPEPAAVEPPAATSREPQAPALATPPPVRLVTAEPAAAPTFAPTPSPQVRWPATALVRPPAATPPPAAPAAAPALPPANAPAVPDLRLTAISSRDGQPVALVNDRLVREGDSFDGVRIVRIGEAEVEVEVRGRRRVLRF